jgi:hypothetical protein
LCWGAKFRRWRAGRGLPREAQALGGARDAQDGRRILEIDRQTAEAGMIRYQIFF